MLNAIYPIIGNQSALPFYLTGIGISDPEYHILRESGLISHQLLFTAEGKGILKVGGYSYIQTEGSVFYLAAGVPHEYYPVNDSWKTCWTVFRGEYLAQQMRVIGLKDFAVKNNACTEGIGQIFSQLMAAAKSSIYGAERCSELMYEYILAMRRALLNDGSEADGLLAPSILLMEEHFSDDITLEQLASAAKVSLQHFCRVFKARTGMRPMEYLARKRIAAAKLLLCNTSDPIAAIGEQCGYRDPTYFGTVFRKYEGISPKEYRRLKGSVMM